MIIITDKRVLAVSTILSFVFFSWGINSWKFSFVGDEWAFYIKALDIIQKHFLVNPLNMQGVYLENPLLGSIWQALFMAIFGATNFAWRLSNTILIIPTSLLFYSFLQKLFNSRTAIWGTILMQWSFYLANYFKLGVVNPQSVALFVGCLCCSELAGRTLRLRYFILTGLMLGISFYVYIGPIYTALIWPFFLQSLKSPIKKLVLKVLVMFVVMGVVVSPGLFDSSHWEAAAKKTIFVREFSGNEQIYLNVYHNFLLFYKNYDYMFNHFISGPYLDILSQILATIGIIVCFLNIRKNSYLAVILGYLSMVVVLGVTSPYAYSPTSRGVFLLPFGFIFAAVGLETLFKKPFFKPIAILIVLIIIGINVYRSQVEYFEKFGLKHTALILKELMQNPGESTVLYLSNARMLSYNYSNLFPMMQAFGVDGSKFRVIESQVYPCNVLPDRILLLDKDFQSRIAVDTAYCRSQIQPRIVTINSQFGLY